MSFKQAAPRNKDLQRGRKTLPANKSKYLSKEIEAYINPSSPFLTLNI